MNTPQEFEPLAVWMGWELTKLGTYSGAPVGRWNDSKGGYKGDIAKTSLTDAECMEAKRRLAAKRYQYMETYIGDGEYYFTVRPFHMTAPIYSAVAPTINQAVEQAILKLIEAAGEAK